MTLAATLPKQEAKSNELETFIVTAYSVGDDYTPYGGITASGNPVGEGMCACDRRFPFGTKFYVPALNRTYTCEDRGGRINGRHIDVYMASRSQAIDFGKKRLKVEIIKQ